MTDDLELVETQLLLDELKKRFDSLVFAASANRRVGEDRVHFVLKGSDEQRAWLCRVLSDANIEISDD